VCRNRKMNSTRIPNFISDARLFCHRRDFVGCYGITATPATAQISLTGSALPNIA